MSRSTMTATKLRTILTLSLFAIVLLGGAGFYFARLKLSAIATDVSHTVVDANASQNNLQTLQTIQKSLASQKDAVNRAAKIVADSKSYQYQDQIVHDLSSYAAKAGITISNINFGDTTTTPTRPAQPAAPGAAAAPAVSGLKSVSVSVTVQSPVNYVSMLRFLHSIEDNLTKMQVASVGLSKADQSTDITSNTLTIEVYTR